MRASEGEYPVTFSFLGYKFLHEKQRRFVRLLFIVQLQDWIALPSDHICLRPFIGWEGEVKKKINQRNQKITTGSNISEKFLSAFLLPLDKYTWNRRGCPKLSEYYKTTKVSGTKKGAFHSRILINQTAYLGRYNWLKLHLICKLIKEIFQLFIKGSF